MKKGRFTKSEQKFIKENHDILSEEEMGLRLDRDPESISKYILDKIKTAPNDAELQASYARQVSYGTLPYLYIKSYAAE